MATPERIDAAKAANATIIICIISLLTIGIGKVVEAIAVDKVYRECETYGRYVFEDSRIINCEPFVHGSSWPPSKRDDTHYE